MANENYCERIFDDWYEGANSEDPLSFDALCAAHPHCAEKFRNAYSRVQSVRSALDQMLAQAQTGTISSMRSVSWSDFLTIVGRLGPPTQRYARGVVVAEGGMGTIVEATDPLLKRQLVLKYLRHGNRLTPGRGRPDDRSLGRFLDEAQITASLDHPYIVPVHDLGIDRSGSIYFAMKRVLGDDLATVYRKIHSGEDGWSRTRGLQIIQKVCEAMAYAHSKNVIHRDLKPNNVMVGQFGEVYVMDWGIARIIDEADTKDIRIRLHSADTPLSADQRKSRADSETPATPIMTMDGDVIGTPAYMPPEQAWGNIGTMGPRSDIYSVGAMLYHLTTGRAPYAQSQRRSSHYEMHKRVRSGPPVRVKNLAPKTSPELIAIIEKAMARSIEERYRSMLELSADIQSYLEARVVAAYESGTLAEVKKWVRRNRGLAGAASILVGLMLLGSLTLYFMQQKLETQDSQIASKDRTTAQYQRQLAHFIDEQDLSALIESEARLWPAVPDRISEMREWLSSARRFCARVDEFRAELSSLLEEFDRAKSADAGAPIAERTGRGLGPKSDRPTTSPEQIERAEHRSRIEAHLAIVRRIIRSIEILTSGNPFGSTIASVERRLRDAETIEADTLLRYEAEWRTAVNAIEAEDRYGHVRIRPTLGLVPIDRDPNSKLFEFWHPRSGAKPIRDAEGRLVIDDDTGMVFVLVPGGRSIQGAQAARSDLPGYDPNARPAESDASGQALMTEVRAFFVAKYEWTQGQWKHLFGTNPSFHASGIGFELDGSDESIDKIELTPRNPVENVSWEECATAVYRACFELPAEAEWEYAARAGTESPWWFGSDPQNIVRFGNISDRTVEIVGLSFVHDADLYDHVALHAPVGRFLPNPFGLHDTIGNCGEWCRDEFDDAGYAPDVKSTSNHAIADSNRPVIRVVRGGSFANLAVESRSAHRHGADSRTRDRSIGVRPVIHPEIEIEAQWPKAEPVAQVSIDPEERSPDRSLELEPEPDPSPTANAKPLSLSWAKVLDEVPDPAIVTDPEIRSRISKTGFPWRVEDHASRIQFVLIPPGTYYRGAGDDDLAAGEDERPRHVVTITRPFYIGRYEVTNEQWTRVTGEPRPGRELEQPVAAISFDQVQNFLRRSPGLRLLSEGEWEYACRAGTLGPRYGPLTEIAWCPSVSEGVAHRVGEKDPNGFGVHDMLGNVWEMLGTEYVDGEYAASIGGVADPGVPVSERHVIRGGSYNPNYDDRQCRASIRGFGTHDTRFRTRGFRVARTPEW